MPRISHVVTAFLLIIGLGASTANAQNAFGGPWPGRAADAEPSEGEFWGELENGFRFVVLPAAEYGEEVNLRLLVAAGRTNEPQGKAGLSYLLAESMFEGTRHFDRKELSVFQLANGMSLQSQSRYEVDLNFTVYRLDLLEPQAGALEASLQLLGDIAGGPRFESDVVQALAKAIEHRAGFNFGQFFPQEASLRDLLTRSSLYQKIGDKLVESEIGNVNVSDLKAYHEKWYTPERMVLVVTGAIDAASVPELIRSQFGALSNGGSSDPIGKFEGRIREKGEVDSEETTNAFGRLTVTNAVEIPNRFSAELERRMYVLDFLGRYAVSLASDSERLGGASVSILGDFVALMIERRGPFIQMLDYLSQTDKAVSRLETYGIRKQDLASAKAKYLELCDSYDLALSAKNYPRILADRAVYCVTKKVPFRHGQALGEYVGKVLDGLDVDQVHALCEEIFKPKNLNYLVELPTGYGIKSKTITKRLKGMRKSYDFTWERAGEIDQDYEIGSGFETTGIVKSTKLIQLGEYPVLQYDFANNVRLNLVRATGFPGRIQVHLAMGNGLTDLANSNAAFATFVRALLPKMKVGAGVQAPTVKDMLIAKGLRNVDVGIDQGQFYWSAEASSDEEINSFLSGMLVWLVTSQLSEDDFDDEKEKLIEAQEKVRGNVGVQKLDTLMWEEEPRLRKYYDSDELDAITFTDIKSWLSGVREKAYVELTVVGDANPRSLLRDVRKSFGSAPVRTGKVMQPRHAKPMKWGEPGVITETENLSYTNGYITLLFPVVEKMECKSMFRQEVFRILMLEHGKELLADAPNLASTFEVSIEGSEMVPGSEALRIQLRCTPDEAEDSEKRLADIVSTFPDFIDDELLPAAQRNVWIDLRWSTRNMQKLVDMFNQSQGRPNALDCTLEVFENGLSGKLDTYREVAKEQFSSGNVRGVALMPEA